MVTRTKQTQEEHEFSDELSANQVIALNAILAGDSFRDAALKASVDERTLRRWRTRDVEFEISLRRSTSDLNDDLGVRVAIGAQKALETILAMAADPDHPRAFQAACYVLGLARVGPPLYPRSTRGDVIVDQLVRFT